MLKEKDEPPVGFYDGWVERNDQHVYWNVAYFIPPGVANDHVVVGVVGFDQNYLRETVFSRRAESSVEQQEQRLASRSKSAGDDDPFANKDYTPWVASENWDGGHSEVERPFSDTFHT